MIRVEKLSFSYPDTPPALHSIDLEINQGDAIALIGANGSGKTTLARCLNGLHIPQEGQVWVDELTTSAPTQLGAIRQRVGMVFQNPDDQFVSTTVADELAFGLENLALPTDEISQRVEDALAAFGLKGFRDTPPHRLSGGEKQRVAIAAVVAMRPSYIVLDEPTALLDPQSRRHVSALLQSLRSEYGIATILITQLPEEAARADRLVILHQGRLYGDSSPSELFAKSAELRNLGLGLPFASSLASHLALAESPLNLDALVDILASREIPDAAPTWTPAQLAPLDSKKLTTESLTHFYDENLPTRHQAIVDIELQVSTGSILALVGVSGSGKTTLAQHFNALLKPSRGRILLDGLDIWSQPPAKIRQRVGLVFQFPELQLFAESVAEDVAFGPSNLGFAQDKIQHLVAESLELVGLPLAGFGQRQPLSLSGGEKRRVALAGILAMDPEVLVLDEPTAGLDPEGTATLCTLFERLRDQGRTLIIISHDIDLVGRMATEIAVMQEGRIHLQGPTRSVLCEPAFADISGLEPPSPVRLKSALQKRGLHLAGDPITLEETIEWLAPLFSKQP